MRGRCVVSEVFVLSGVLTALVPALAYAQPTAGFPPPEAEPPPEPPPTAAPAPVEPPTQAPAPLPPSPPRQAAPERSPLTPDDFPTDLAPELAPEPELNFDPRALPPVLPYRPGYPIPPGYHAESRSASGLVATGGITLGLAYIAALGIAMADDFENGTGWLAVPLVGPWGAIGARSFECKAETDIEQARACFDGAYKEATTIAVLAGDGVVQAIGTALFVAGLTTRTHELVRDDEEGVHVSASPRLGGGFDLGLHGRF